MEADGAAAMAVLSPKARIDSARSDEMATIAFAWRFTYCSPCPVSPATGRFPKAALPGGSVVPVTACSLIRPMEWREFLEGALRTASVASEARVYRDVKREFLKEKLRS